METDFSGEEKQAIATVAASTYRHRALRALLDDGPLTPTAIADATGIEPSHVSRALTDLREVGCVELLVEEQTRKGRVHGATERGETVAEVVGDE